MSKLFALEEIEEIGVVDQLETNPEEGEVADVQVDMVGEVSGLDTQVTAIDDGMGAADQLEAVQEVVGTSVEEGEGLSPLAAEAARIAVEAICARVGANPKSMYALYATENFQSASSRKANSRIALEGVGDFLKNLWEKIKAAVSNIWNKVTEFWNKHISSLGRVLKALESMKTKVSSTKGSPNQGSDEIKASSGLISTFTGKGDVDTKSIHDFIATHTACQARLKLFDASLTDAIEVKTTPTGTSLSLRKALLQTNKQNFDFGTSSNPLAGGVYFKNTFEVENAGAGDDDSITLKLEVEEEQSDEKDTDRDLYVASKDNLKKSLTDTITLIKETIKVRDRAEKNRKDFEKTKKVLDKAISEIDTQSNEGRKAARRKANQALRAFSTMQSKIPTMGAKLAALDVRLAKGVLEYCGACLKHYK